MFAKPYKLKANTTLKNSEKKHLAQRIKDAFPKTSEEKVKELVPVKSSCVCMKLVLSTGDTVSVYAVDNVPVMIECAEGLVPTVCALWKVPDLLPVLAMHTPVLPKVQGGAPLYLPGIAIPAQGIGFPMFPKGSLLAVCTQDNAAAGVVGRAIMSSGDMVLRAGGVCLETYHTVGDLLCKDPKFSKIERPKLAAATYGEGSVTDMLATDIEQLSIHPAAVEEWPRLGPAPPAPPARHQPQLITVQLQAEAPHDDSQTELDSTAVTDTSQMEESDNIPTDMDGLLQWCFLTFLKVEGKRVELPLKTNLLYKNHIQAMCPPDRTLDVKKSSYKKLGKFLEAMQKEGLVEVRELEKGVDAVVALSLQNSLLAEHSVPADVLHQLRAPPDQPPRDYAPPLVRELHCVTAHVQAVLAPHKKGTPMSSSEVRATLVDYVKTHDLNSGKGGVKLDTALAAATGGQAQSEMKWDALMNAVLNKMTASTEMRFADGGVRLSKTRLEPIKMQVANRSGNKKVTLVSNLESFGFSLPALSHVCQTGVAASCGVTRTPGAKADQLMLQGDQTHFVAKLLIEKYGLPKKFLEGADKALNKKNK